MVTSGLYWAKLDEIAVASWTWIYLPNRIVPLRSVHVEAVVVDASTEVKITQKYFNPFVFPIEAQYLFPLDENSAVCEFEAEINGKRIIGVSKEKNQAKKEYRQAIARGDGAYLLEQEKADIFKASVGNIPPGCEVSVSIKYVAEIKNELDKVRFVIPTNVAPRYSPAGYGPSLGSEADPLTPYKLSLNATCYTQSGFKSIESPSHLITASINSNTATIVLDHGVTELNKDFVVLICYTNPHEPKVIVEDNGKGSYAAMLSICPHLEFVDNKTELIFLIDRSGSMSSKVTEVRQAMKLFLRSLPEDSFFNIIGFGSNYVSLFKSSTRYSDESLTTADNHCSSLLADLGGTELYQPLKFIFEQTSIPGYSRQVFVLTDGQVSNTEQVISLVSSNNKKSRLFALGIGNDVSHHLVEGMARAGKGTSFFVLEGERIEKKVMKQLKDATQPSISEVKVDWGLKSSETTTGSIVLSLLSYVSPSTKATTFNQAPYYVPPIFSDNLFRIYCIFQSEKLPAKVVLNAKSPDGVLHAELPVDTTKIVQGNLLHTLAARIMIRDLEEGSTPLKGQSNIRSEVVRLGTTYGLASQYTSFIAVEERSLQEKLYSQDQDSSEEEYKTKEKTKEKSLKKKRSKPLTSFPVPAALATPAAAPSKKMRGSNISAIPPPAPRSASYASPAQYSDKSRSESSGSEDEDDDENDEEEKERAVEMEEAGEMEEKMELDTAYEIADLEKVDKKEKEKEKKKDSKPKPKPSMPSLSKSSAPKLSSSSSSIPSDPRDRMVSLLGLQGFQGSFSENTIELVFRMSSKATVNPIDVTSLSSLKDNLSLLKVAWATALALAFLQKYLSQFTDEWEMAANKAKKWLNNSKVDQQVLSDAMAAI